MNKRRNQRLELALSGELTIGADSHFIETRDVSLSGAWIDYLPRAREVGGECYLTLFVGPEDSAEAVTFRGRIAVGGADGCGVQFLSVDDQDFPLFAEELLRHAPDQAALRQEIQRGFVPATEEWATL